MELRRWEIWFSAFDEDVAYLVVAAMFPLAVISIDNKLAAGLVSLGFLYVLVAAARFEWYRYRSRKIGMCYFFIVPSLTIPLLRRGKLKIPGTVRVCWKIHVCQRQLKRGLRETGGRRVLRNRQADIRLLASLQWEDEPFLVGSTYVSVGHLKEPNVEMTVYDFPLFPWYEWLRSRKRILEERRQFMGGCFNDPNEIKWTTMTFRVK